MKWISLGVGELVDTNKIVTTIKEYKRENKLFKEEEVPFGYGIKDYIFIPERIMNTIDKIRYYRFPKIKVTGFGTFHKKQFAVHHSKLNKLTFINLFGFGVWVIR